MSQSITIRGATPNDWPTITDYNQLLAQETEGIRLDRATVEAGVRALLAEPARGRYFVACLDSRIVGQLMHTREWSDWRNGEIWWLQSVFVHPDHRQTGIFRALYRHIEQLAQQTPGVVGLRLYVEDHNVRAMDAYQSLAMQPAGYKVMQRLFQHETST